MLAWIDGRFVSSSELPALDAGRLSPFETMGARDGDLPLWGLHLARLRRSAKRLGLDIEESVAEWRAAASELLRDTGNAEGILRIALLPAGGALHVVMKARPRSPASTVKILPTAVERSDDAPPADLKVEPRTFYDHVLQQAQDAGADDGIVVDPKGRVLETATANLWLRIDGVWLTPQADGGLLPGIARGLLLERAKAAGVATGERALFLADLHRAEALAVSNAVYGPRAASLGSAGISAAEIVVATLGELWAG